MDFTDAVVVGIDGSESALYAAEWAAREARRRNTQLLLLHVGQLPATPPWSPVALPKGFDEALIEIGEEWLRHASEVVRAAEPDVHVEERVVLGGVTAELRALSEHATVIVLGSRGLGAISSLLVGSVAVSLSAHARCPVVVVRGERDEQPPVDGPVVVGLDGSTQSDIALGFAFDMAARSGVALVAVTVAHTGVLGAVLPVVSRGDGDQDSDEAAAVAEQLATWREKYPDIEVVQRHRQGKNVRELLDEAGSGLRGKPAQLLVVGSRGRGALSGVGLGSVSQALLHRANCPIAVVPMADQGDEEHTA